MTQIKKKWIGNDQVNGSKTLLDNNQALRGKKADNEVVELMKLSPEDVLHLYKTPVVPAPSTEPLALATVSQVNDAINAIPSVNLDPYLKKDGSVEVEGNLNFKMNAAGADTHTLDTSSINDLLDQKGTIDYTELEYFNINTVDGLPLQFTVVAGEITSTNFESGSYKLLEFSAVNFTSMSAFIADGTYNLINGLNNIAWADLGANNAQFAIVFTDGAGGSATFGKDGEDRMFQLVHPDFVANDISFVMDSDFLGPNPLLDTMTFYPSSAGGPSHRITGLADGVDANDAVNKSQLDAEAQARNQADSALQSAINAVEGGTQWRKGVFLISEDAELVAAQEGDLISAIMPFSDDEIPEIQLADFEAGQLLLAKNGANSKLMKVYDDAGTLKVTFVDVETLQPKFTYIVTHDLTDSPGPQEGLAIFHFDGTDLFKLGDLDFSLASGINMGTFGPLSGIEEDILSTDSVAEAIHKLASSLAFMREGIVDYSDAVNFLLDELQSSQYLPSKEIITLSAQDITNGYIDLDKLIVSQSLNMSVNRLMMYEGATEDYTLSTEGGVTRITFLNALVVPSESALEEGEKIYLSYLFRASEQL